MAVRGLRFLLLASAAGCTAALVAAAFRKRRKAGVLPKRTLKIIFAGLPTEEQKVRIMEETVRNLTQECAVRPVFLYIVPDASAGKEARKTVLELSDRLDALFQCESRIFEAQLYYDLNPMAEESDVLENLARDISAEIDCETDVCLIVLSDGTVRAFDGSAQSLGSLFRGGRCLECRAEMPG